MKPHYDTPTSSSSCLILLLFSFLHPPFLSFPPLYFLILTPTTLPFLHSSFGSQQMLSGKQWFLSRAMIRYLAEDNRHTRVLRRSNILINHCHVCRERSGGKEERIKEALKVCRKSESMWEREGCGERVMAYRARLFRVQCRLQCFQYFKMQFPLLPRPPPLSHFSYFHVGFIKVCTLHSLKFIPGAFFLDELSQGSNRGFDRALTCSVSLLT